MCNRTHVRREVHQQALKTHHQSIRACTTPVLIQVTGEEQRRFDQLSN